MDRPTRESIWSVPNRMRQFYGVLFIFLFSAGTYEVWRRAATVKGLETTVDRVLHILPLEASMGVAAATASLVTADVLEGAFLVSDIVRSWRDKKVAKNRRIISEIVSTAVDEVVSRRANDISAEKGEKQGEFVEPEPKESGFTDDGNQLRVSEV